LQLLLSADEEVYMTEIGVLALLALTVVVVVMQIFLLRRPSPSPPDFSEVLTRLTVLYQSGEQADRGVREEFSRLRNEIAGQHQVFKLEVASSLNTGRTASAEYIQQFRIGTEQRLDHFGLETNQKIELLRHSVTDQGARLQTQVSQELERLRVGLEDATRHSRAEVTAGLKVVSEALTENIGKLVSSQNAQMDEIRGVLENRLGSISSDNERRLEQIRQTVEEKLQTTLEARLGESFKHVSDRLEQVHKGLGEMQTLALGVGDLKRVLTNVKTRGTWGEIQLGNLLEQILTTD